ncbi:hypothetical protein SAMN05444483_10396 [Salegentibacter echinorum]|uniref:Uncharacterized protein n=1 Tax=Salegentibacter echinorum TaxID=1073325 RepID=A0A1M5FAN9_SALEC|nr:hypothetical protein [Salegentibacter echinorum]SHF88478.1 hypothetical protein SAMN05444483_10396 [Salegentibacter echinorum]
MNTKARFHKLIDAIGNDKNLKSYYKLVNRLHQNESGELWKRLSELEKDELLLSYEESLDSSKLISHEKLSEKHSKWFIE